MALSATVQKLINFDNDRMALSKDRSAFLAQWRADVEAVYVQFSEALQTYTSSGTATILVSHVTLTEEAIGDYDIPSRIIDVVGRRVHLVPQARFVPGATGRLDLYRESRPSEANRILLLRGAVGVGHAPDAWMIQDRRGEPSSLENAMDTFKKLRESRRVFRLLDAASIQDSIDYVLNL